MKYCTQCGAYIEDNVKYCPICGANLSEEMPAAFTQEPADNGSLSWQRVASKIILIVAKVAIIIAIVYFATLMVILLAKVGRFVGDFPSAGGVSVALILVELIIFVPIMILSLVFIDKTLKRIKENRKISTALKICTLIFGNTVAGIFLLTESNDKYAD